METKATYFVVDGSARSCQRDVSESYFRENLAATLNGVKILRRGGGIDLFAASRYLPPDTTIDTEVADGELRVIWRGEVLRKFTEWLDVVDVAPRDYPLGVASLP